MKPNTHSIATLEADVLNRITRHRAGSDDRLTLSASTLLVIAALTAGLAIGFGRAQSVTVSAAGSESIVLAETTRVAPSDLLARIQ